MGQNRGNVKEEVSVQGITQSHQIGRQNACDDGGFQASLHKHQGFVRSQGACKGLALKRGVPSLGGVGGRTDGGAMTLPDTTWRGNVSYSD